MPKVRISICQMIIGIDAKGKNIEIPNVGCQDAKRNMSRHQSKGCQKSKG